MMTSTAMVGVTNWIGLNTWCADKSNVIMAADEQKQLIDAVRVQLVDSVKNRYTETDHSNLLQMLW